MEEKHSALGTYTEDTCLGRIVVLENEPEWDGNSRGRGGVS
jgi:tRNA(Phe) wybutosine-synthesizing methylase Tyw3